MYINIYIFTRASEIYSRTPRKLGGTYSVMSFQEHTRIQTDTHTPTRTLHTQNTHTLTRTHINTHTLSQNHTPEPHQYNDDDDEKTLSKTTKASKANKSQLTPAVEQQISGMYMYDTYMMIYTICT